MFYHLEKCGRDVVKEFKPRIPANRLPEENEDIKRICVSSSIEGALGSVSWGGSYLNNIGINVPIRIYEFEKTTEMINPRKLVKKGYVQDALNYDEYWILNRTKPKKHYYVLIKSYLEFKDAYFESKYYDLIEENIYYEDLDDLDSDYYISDTTIIYDLKYEVILEKDIQLGNEFNIDISDLKDHLKLIGNIDAEVEYLMRDYISRGNEVKSVSIKNNILKIKTKEAEGLAFKKFKNDLKSMVERL